MKVKSKEPLLSEKAWHTLEIEEVIQALQTEPE